MLSFVFSASLLFYLLRIEFYRKMIIRRRSNFFRKNILIIGAGKAGKKMAENLINENPYGVNIIGFLDDNISKGLEAAAGKTVLGRPDQIKEIAGKYYLDEAIIAIDNIEYLNALRIIDKFKGLNLCLKISSDRFDIIRRKFSREKYGNLQVVDITPPVNQELKIKMKRVIDVIGAGAGLIILSPLLLLITLLIKISSRGPILFRQTRIGYRGKPFEFYKFRSMYMIAGEDEERKKMMIEFMKKNKSQAEDRKIINDKRVTWIGKFIRKTSLDELPQLFNVLKGDMSLVGPRPCLTYEYENYDEWQRRRVEVLPGCTGVWQVSGRSEVTFDESVLLDLYYINKLSLFFDFRILLKTIPVMFFSKGGK
jgi:exopolysaccharide biosynthesis polyprenyl glycosylphosphotransferase